MSEEIGDEKGTASFYRVLETVYLSCSEHVKATESYEKSLSVMKETHLTDRGFEASHTRAWEWCIKISMNMGMLSSIMGKHL